MENIKIPVALKMDPELHKRVKIYCIEKDLSMQDFVESALIKALPKENSYVKQP